MRLPSVERLVGEARATLARFPLVVLTAGVAAGFGLLSVDLHDEVWSRSLLAATLGLPLFVCLTLTAERRGWRGARLALAAVIGFGILAAFWGLRPRWSEPVAWTRFFQLAVALHLFVAWLPYLGADEPNGFWQYNRALFLRFLTAALYTVVLWAGLSVALLAVDRLFGVEVEGDTYLRLWIVLAFLFHTWFFLAGIPRDLAALESRTDYPTGLKIFAQFVLVPIVAIYLLILTLYMGKVAITRVWPSGWIGWLVSGVAGLGILSLLLVHPVRERAENRWIPAYTRLFWVGLFPSILMLLLAIWKRVEQYGITERRYFLIVLAVWLAGIAAWYTATRSRNLKPIPATLALLALVTLGGPWGAYAVSERSQLGRLEELLSRNALLVDGRARRAAGEVSFEDRKEISGALRYLIETHGSGGFEGWFEGGLAGIDTIGARGDAERWRAGERAGLIMAHLAVPYVEPWQASRPDLFLFSADPAGEALPISGYQYAFRVDRSPVDSARIGAGAIRVELGPDSLTLVVSRDGRRLVALPLAGALEEALAEGVAGPGRPASAGKVLRVEADSGGIAALFYLRSASGRRTAGRLRLESAVGDLYLRLE